MPIAILDPAAGISGDMTLGALLALGLPASWLEELPLRLGLEGVGVTIRDARRASVGCKQVEFTIPPQPHGRHVGELVQLVEKGTNPDRGRRIHQVARVVEPERAVTVCGIWVWSVIFDGERKLVTCPHCLAAASKAHPDLRA